MSTKRFTPEFKDEAVGQVTERGYAVSELLEAKSEILRLRAQLRRTEKKRGIQKKPPATEIWGDVVSPMGCAFPIWEYDSFL